MLIKWKTITHTGVVKCEPENTTKKHQNKEEEEEKSRKPKWKTAAAGDEPSVVAVMQLKAPKSILNILKTLRCVL